MNRALLCFSLVGLSIIASVESVKAQAVVSDASLNTIVTRSGNTFTIDNGTTTGTNLFHSFREFSIPTGGAAVFNNTTNTQNIFSRVTGGTVSNIDGRISTNGSANLFLLNPSGILFGANAFLNIGGSFVGSTASSIKFADGMEFSAVNPTSQPLLTMSVPIGLQMGQSPSPITQQAQLAVLTGNTLALVGGTLQIQGGQLTAADGRIELASVAPNQQVTIAGTAPAQPLSLTYSDNTVFQDLTLSQGARVDIGGNQGGSLQIRGRNIALIDGSVITGRVNQQGSGNQLLITATESVKLAGTNAKGTAASSINSQLGTLATGQGSDIVVRTSKLQLMDGGQIVGGLSGAIGQGGNVSVIADEIEAIGIFPNWTPSGITNSLSNQATGRGGNLTVQATKIRLINGAQIGSGIYDATGQVGDVSISASEIEAIGVSSNGIFPSAFVDSQGGRLGGNGGNLTIKTERLRLINGGQIGTGVYTETGGNAANINITATDIVVAGVDSGGIYNSGIATAFAAPAAGRGGNLSITTETLNLSDGAQILSIVYGGQGNAGNITVNAKQITASGIYEPSNYVTGLFATAEGGATGNAGDLRINTQVLKLSDGAQISAGVLSGSTGNAGNIEITAQKIQLSGVNGKTPTRLSTLVDQTAKGQGGDIFIQSGEVVLQEGAEITSQSKGTGDAGSITLTLSEVLLLRNQSLISTEAGGTGGNISVRSPFIVGLENSDIVANAIQGRGGNINITTQGIIGLTFRNTLTPREDLTNDITASSQFNLNGTVQVNNLGIDPNFGLIELAENLSDASQQIAKGCASNRGSRFIMTGRGRIPMNPVREYGSTNRTWRDLRAIAATQIEISAQTPQPLLVEATSWQRNLQTGKVELMAARPVSSTQSATCD